MIDLETVSIAELSGDTITVERANGVWEADRDAVAFISAEGWVDRESAVRIVEALTARIEAADTREAKEARKLKRGDRVYLIGDPQDSRTVIADEDANGLVDVVNTGGADLGGLQERVAASLYRHV